MKSKNQTTPSRNKSLHAKEILLDIDEITIRYGELKALAGVSLCVHEGEFIGLVGPNGSGKTTLVKAILGLIKVQGGMIDRHISSSIGYVPQRGQIYNSQVPISVSEVVKLGSRGNNAQAQQALKAVQLEGMERRRFNELSGGQQQRVIIAKALASQPSLLLLDEPTTGIDEKSQNEFNDILKSLKQRGITIVMVSHDVDMVRRLVTRVILLNQKILYDGSPENFEINTYLPDFYKKQHRLLHHHHGGKHA